MRDLVGRTLGHSRIVEKIGEGGMVIANRIEHTEPIYRVASREALRRELLGRWQDRRIWSKSCRA
jgi:hypothetical protein